MQFPRIEIIVTTIEKSNKVLTPHNSALKYANANTSKYTDNVESSERKSSILMKDPKFYGDNSNNIQNDITSE